MARLALSVGLGILGAVLIPGVGAALGFAIGSAIGGIIGQLAFPGKGTHVYGPRVNDMQVSSSAPGAVIPLLFGTMRLGGQIIWSTGLQETTTTTSQSAKGGPSVTQTTYTYTVSFAAGFAQGPGVITRIWGDSKLIYNQGGTQGVNKGAWNSSSTYNVNDLVTWTDKNTYICMVGNIGQPPDNGNYWAQDLAATDINISKYNPPILYKGDENQLPNPLIASTEGATVTPAYRGLVYGVWEDFPLADFGNRLPNIRAEVTSNGVNSYPLAVIPWIQSNTNQPFYCIKDPTGQIMWTWNGLANGGTDPAAALIQRIDLSSNEVVAQGSISVGIPLTSGDPGGPYHFQSGDQYPGADGCMCVDAAGYLWGKATIGGKRCIVQVDPWTFSAIQAIDLHKWTDGSGNDEGVVFDIFSLHAITNADGGSYIIGYGQTLTSAQRVVFVCGAAGGGLTGQYFGFDATTERFSEDFQICDNIGNVYVLTEAVSGGNPTGDWKIRKINYLSGVIFPKGTPPLPAGPIFSSVQTTSFGANATRGIPRAMLYNLADNTLVLMTNGGAFLKIDANTMAVLDELGGNNDRQFGIGNIGGPWQQQLIEPGALGYEGFEVGGIGNIMQMAFQGFIQNGIIVGPSLSTDNSFNNILVFSVSDFSKINEYNLANFGPAGAPSGSNWPQQGAGAGSVVYDNNGGALIAPSAQQDPGFIAGHTPYSHAIYRAFLNRISTNGLTAAEIVQTICELAEIPDANVDVSQLVGIAVQGYPVTSLTAGKDMICTLGQAYFFEGRESDFKLQFVPRGQSPVLTIPEDDLGLVADNAELTETIGQEQDVPKSVEIIYIDPNQDYQQGQQKRVRHSVTKKTNNQTSISLPLVLNQVQAAQLADKIMWTAENERRSYKTNLWKAIYMLLDPCDVVNINYHGAVLAGHCTEGTIGQNYATAFDVTSEDTFNYSSVATGTNNGGFKGQTVGVLANTLLWILDIPLLQDQDADGAGNMGYYFAMAPDSSASAWAAGVLYNSSDNATFNQLDASTRAVAYGVAQNQLAAPPLGPFTWDFTSTLTVRMSVGANPVSDTMLNVLNGTNAAVLYPSLEVIQFTTVVNNGDGTCTISGLLRGRRGTDDFINNHRLGELVFFPLMQGGVVHEQVSLSLLNLLRYYKGITVGAPINSNPISQPITLKGRDLMPYAPSAFYTQASGSDILFTWFRRTRLGGGWQDGSGVVPLAEDTEAYSIDIIDPSGNVKRTFNNITPPGGVVDSWTSPAQPHQLYTAAQQTADGYTAHTGWTAICYQLSAQVGRGFPTPVNLP